jgi:serine/threonine-protein kinase
MGRADDCEPRLPNDQDHSTISRHHCLLDISPPLIRIRDFGSLNGTYVNGRKIGQRKHGQAAGHAAADFPQQDLRDGDSIGLGKTVFEVGVYEPAFCSHCSAEIPDGRRAALQINANTYQCDACRHKIDPTQLARPPRNRCAKCNRDVSEEVGRGRPAEYICTACRADPMQLIGQLIAEAKSGLRGALAIRGYEIERELGRGGMGAVYLARRKDSGEVVALKVMLPQVPVDEQKRNWFLREMENTKALNHANVVQLRDAGCSNGTFFFTLEYCAEGSIKNLIQEHGGRIPLTQAAPLMLQTLDGLAYAHQAPIPNVQLRDGSCRPGRGLVHRDLKPENIFLTSVGGRVVAKVGDFGMAKAFDAAGLSGYTMTNQSAGTPVYMPRQQVLNFKYAKPDVDVWAAAASFYTMLTGSLPREFSKLRKGQDVYKFILDEGCIPIRQRDPSIPKKVAKVIDTALREKPRIGFQNAVEFKRALEGAL